VPELPEVETVKRGLVKRIIGKTIKSVDFDWLKSFPNSPEEVEQFLISVKITTIRRRAKILIIDLDSDYSLLIHLKMTGQLVYVGADRFGAGHPSDSLIGNLPDRSTRVTFEFSDNSQLFFNDQRKFGWVKLIPTAAIKDLVFFQNVGPEPLLSDFTAKEFVPRIRRRANTSIKAAILDQTVLAGVGNIYADESLFAAEIHPARLVKNISDDELGRLLQEIKAVMSLSIEKGGSSDRNYVNAEGKKGSYISFAKVFRKENTPCQVCGTTIIKTKVAARGTHICPNCQRLKK
jgi:formamidopyrimidine-DNA glycosylase